MRIFVRILKYLSLTLMAVVLLAYGLLVCTVTLLTPQKLTPIANAVLNQSLQNAKAEIGNVELSMRKTFPYLTVRIDSLVIVSTVMQELPPERRAGLDTWADTLLRVHRFEGGLDVPRLTRNIIAFSDVVLERPELNVIVIDSLTTNFDIIPPSEPSDPNAPSFFDDPLGMGPARFEMRRLAVKAPRGLRYRDLTTGTHLDATLQDFEIDGNKQPQYVVKVDGNLQTPQLLEFMSNEDLHFGLDGTVRWNQAEPGRVGIDDFTFGVSIVEGRASADVLFNDKFTIEKMQVDFNPISVQEAVGIIPGQMRKDWGIPKDFATTASVKMSARLLNPYIVAGERLLPNVEFNFSLPDASVTWQRYKLERVGTDLRVTITDDNLDRARIDLKRLDLGSKAINLSVKGKISNVLSDPFFDGTVKGSIDLTHLPPVLRNMIPGTVQGSLKANASIKGSPSMLTPQKFSKLKVEGTVDLNNLYWVAADTINMVQANHVALKFGTSSSAQTSNGNTVSNLLTASVAVDSANILHSDIAMKLTDFKLGLGSQKPGARKADRHVVPMGGGIHIGHFKLTVLTDSVTFSLRDASGRATVRAHDEEGKKPEFGLNINIGRLRTGDNSTRFIVRDAALAVTTWPQPQSKRAERVATVADSLRNVHPEIPYDSIYAMALRIHNSRPRSKYARVHPVMVDSTTEVIDFGTSRFLNEFLSAWAINGTLTSNRANLFTPYFPLRNRLKHVDITFNNDTIALKDIEYKAGHSDFTLNGRVTNLRRALTSRKRTQPLRVNLELVSDTIDVNQLTATTMRGSVYSEQAAAGNKLNLGNIEDEEALEKAIGSHVQDAPDAMAPILVPRNIEADFKLKANHVFYSDLLLNRLRGNALIYQGNLNLNRLSARSDVGDLRFSALYEGRDADSLNFGFGLELDRFNISRFLQLMPAVDSIMPVLRDFSGIISADMAATTKITRAMDFDLPSLDAALKIEGDSLVLIDPDTFKSLSKWLMFKDKKRNIIDHMSVQMLVDSGRMQVYPFIFDIDRYKLGVQGTNDFALNFNYHIAVLKSPIPFKFGINISGNPDDFKIRLGGAKFNEKTVKTVPFVADMRINLLNEIQGVFRRGLKRSRFNALKTPANSPAADINLNTEATLTDDELNQLQTE